MTRTCACVVLFALCACAHGGTPAPRPDEVLAADRQFAHDTLARGADGWASWFAEDGLMFPAGQPAVQGRDRIREFMSDLRDPRTGQGELTIEWEPIGGGVSASGDLGWTYGSARIGTRHGERLAKYLTVWRRQPDGTWRVQADLGNPGPATAPPPAR